MAFLAIFFFLKNVRGGYKLYFVQIFSSEFKFFQIFKKYRENFQQILPKGGRGGQRPFRKLQKKIIHFGLGLCPKAGPAFSKLVVEGTTSQSGPILHNDTGRGWGSLLENSNILQFCLPSSNDRVSALRSIAALLVVTA